MPNIKELIEQRKSAMAELEAAETKDAIDAASKSISELDEQIEAMNAKKALIEQLGAKAAPVVVKGTSTGARTLGEHFVKSREGHVLVDNRFIAAPFSAKAAGDPTPSTGLVPTQYDTDVVRRVAAPLTVLDLFPRKSITASIYSWNTYTATTGSVGTTAEGAAKNKLTYSYEPKSANLQKITGIIKLTDELFEDAPYVADAINQDLVDDLDANRQAQAIATLLGTSGLMTANVAANATDLDLFKAILKAAADVEDTTHIAADAVVVTPAIWLRLRSAVDGDSQFYAGNPFGASGYATLFGLTFVKSADVTANHVIVGAFGRGAELASKADGVRVESTNSNDTDFEHNIVTIRAEVREILAVKRPGCFCNITVAAS